MTNENPKIIQEIILNRLKSNDIETVAETIAELSESGNISYLPGLFDLLSTSKSEEIKKSISQLLSNLKDKDSVPLLVAAIQNPGYQSELKQLVSSCWENGLDYSYYLTVFVDLMIQKDFIIAFEAYTVIVNTETKIDQNLLDIEIDKLEKALHFCSEDIRPLLLDVIDFLPSIGF